MTYVTDHWMPSDRAHGETDFTPLIGQLRIYRGGTAYTITPDPLGKSLPSVSSTEANDTPEEECSITLQQRNANSVAQLSFEAKIVDINVFRVVLDTMRITPEGEPLTCLYSQITGQENTLAGMVHGMAQGYEHIFESKDSPSANDPQHRSRSFVVPLASLDDAKKGHGLQSRSLSLQGPVHYSIIVIEEGDMYKRIGAVAISAQEFEAAGPIYRNITVI